MYDVSEYRRAETALALLAEVSEVLTESERDYEDMLRRLTQLVVPRMADWCAIDLWQDGEIRNVGVAHIDPDKVALAHDLQRRLPPDPDSPRGVGNVLRTGRSELMAEIPEELIDAASPDPEIQQLLRDLGLHSAIVAPLIAHGEVLGALTLISAEQRRTYTADDVVVAEDLGRRAALSISNARLFREQEEVNHALLESLVPARLPQLEGVDVAAVYQAAGHGSEVGGDFYDLWETSSGSFAVVVGDVQGKGPRAAALTGLARHTIRAGSLHTSSPAAVLEMLNEAILRSDFDRFVTVAYIVVERDATGLTGSVAVAGHMPVMIRRSGGTVERAGELGSLIGLYPDVTITEQRVSLLPGDTLLLWTDGVTERRRGEEQFGEERLEGILASLEPGDDSGTTVRRIAEAVRGFTPEPMQDDMAIVAVQVLPAMASEAAA